MGALRRNLTASILSRLWMAFAGLIVVPLYVKFLGVESYGLVGFFVAVSGILGVLDMGLSATLNRELARNSAQNRPVEEVRDLIKTLQAVYWAVGLLISLMILASARPIARYWISPDQLAVQTVEQAVMLMGFVLAAQWPIALYTGGLMGLQRQVLVSGLNAGLVTVRSLGALLVLWLISPSILAFLAWQGLTSLLAVVVIGRALWNSLPQSPRGARFRLGLLQAVWRFAAGMSANSMLVLAVSQLDKIVLSKLLSLEMFGYYALALSLAGGLGHISSPIFSTLFPGLSHSLAIGDPRRLSDLYHRGCQCMTVILGPATVLLAFFAPEIMRAWTRSSLIADKTHLLVTLMAIATGLNGLVSLPYALTLAAGWTRLSVYTNGLALVVLAPLTILMTIRFGPVGAATVPIILNAGYILIFIQLMHRRLLPGENWRWYMQDTGIPLAVACLILGIGRLFPGGRTDGAWTLLWLAILWGLAFLAASLSASTIGPWLRLQMSSVLRTSQG